ncbi:hypothetical protein BD770DRAFT_379503 [Pilaira anomala]|nr:hypothetical protein BD770DRAFT_379503 [Pilaira anomala]
MDKRQFEEQRQELLVKAFAGLDQMKNNLDILNRNIDVINAIGSQFKAPALLWDSFHKALGTSEEENIQDEKKGVSHIKLSPTKSSFT